MGPRRPLGFLLPPLRLREGWMGEQGQGVASLGLGNDSGKSLGRLARRMQLHQLVLGRQLQMMRFTYMPAAPRPPPCPPSQGHAALFAFQPPCRLPGPEQFPHPPSPTLGLWFPLDAGPAAFIFLCFLCGNCGVICSPDPCPGPSSSPGLGPMLSGHSTPLSDPVRAGRYQGPEERVAGFGGCTPKPLRGNTSSL